ncbi:MAG: CvpA family protein [Pseudomonadota bacterium]
MITWLDVILLAVMLISGLLAMMRGFTREVFSVVSWGAAAVAAFWAYPRFQEAARGAIQPDYLADGLLLAGVFLFVLVLVSFITFRISDMILDSRVGALDRTLGFAFGLGRGLVIVVIAFLFFTWLVDIDDQPSWVQEARFRPLLQNTGDALVALLPDNPEETIEDLIGRDV